MAKYTLEEKLGFVEHVVLELREFWIKYKGELHNHKDFWDATLHAYTNEDWELMMEIMELIRIEDPDTYLRGSKDVFDQVRKVLMYEGHSGNPRALDRRKHKSLAFKALMNVKDVMNNFSGYEQPTKFAPDPEPPSQFELLFPQGE